MNQNVASGLKAIQHSWQDRDPRMEYWCFSIGLEKDAVPYE